MSVPLSYNLRNLIERRATTLMTALGIALTVGVLVTAVALIVGLHGTFAATGDPLGIVVLRKGVTAELNSSITQDAYERIRMLPDVAREKGGPAAHEGVMKGEPMVSPELISVINLPSVDNPSGMNVTVRGLLPIGVRMRRLRVVAGEWFGSGRREVVVGKSVAKRYASAHLGATLHFGRGDWKVVGVFDGGKGGESAVNSEIWCDLNQLAADFQRQANMSSVLVRAVDPVAAKRLVDTIQYDRLLDATALPEQDYYASMTNSGIPLQVLGTFVAAIMAVGSAFGAMNTMYAAVARRGREIGTLRSLGFTRRSILASFIAESIALSLLGGIIGCALAWPLNWVTTGIGNFETFSEIAFNFRVGPVAIAVGMVFAGAIGLFGGYLPARAAARRDLLTTLREA
ncbi:MAG TPA: FtsX-like permease family protein [Tepidisphaeraceae bacterium]|jgi:ABC-type antimicrobial peptide transport system permease subunit|nr:FtsX-like permease family protein [Tepidisphaeraceae bacterium]